MNKLYPFSLDYYNKAVIRKMIEKYGFNEMTATRLFLTSEVHRMLENAFEDIDCLEKTGRHAW